MPGLGREQVVSMPTGDSSRGDQPARAEVTLPYGGHEKKRGAVPVRGQWIPREQGWAEGPLSHHPLAHPVLGSWHAADHQHA